MEDYPDFCIDIDGYNPEYDEGVEIFQALSGKPWKYTSFSQEVVTFKIVHPNMTADDEDMLRKFYRDNKGDYVHFTDPRTNKGYEVLMTRSPRIESMVSGKLANISMELIGTEV